MKRKASKPGENAGKKTKKPAAKGSPETPPQAALSKAQMGAVRKKLMEMREDLVATVQRQAVGEPDETGDAADQASQSLEREILFNLSDNERLTLDQVEAALRKLDKGSYGICESCRKPIAKARLEALPFARYCIGCQSSSERPSSETAEPSDFRVVEE